MDSNKVSARNNISKFSLAILLILIAAEALITAAIMLQHSSEAEAGAFFGFSIPRILMVGTLIALACSTAGMSIALFRSETRRAFVQNWISSPVYRARILWSAMVIGGLAWLGLWMPDYRLGGSAGYITELSPLLKLAVVVACETVAFFYLQDLPILVREMKEALRKNAGILAGWGTIMGIIVLTWILIASTGLGINSNGEDYWYEAGVPLLTGQALLALVIGLIAVIAEGRGKNRDTFKRTDLFIFLAIWIIAGLIWSLTPVPNGYFNPGPFPPANETYPYSDAAKFDLQSQFALIGQGLGNGGVLSRPAYPTFLVLIHVLTGQDYDRNMNIQAVIFGVFPAIVYMIGSALVNRSAGISAAAVTFLRGLNGISATAILNLANPKQMLSDFPTAIGIALSLLLGVLWFKSPGKMRLPLLAGGAIALSIYLRPTAFGIIPAVLLLAFLAYNNISKKWLFSALTLLVAGFLAATAPWETRAYINTGSGIYSSSLRKIFSTLESRFPSEGRNNRPGTQSADPQEGNGRNPQESKDMNEDRFFPGEREISRIQLDPGMIANHFLHNVATSILIMPGALEFHDLRTTVKAENSFWRSNWTGGLSPEQYLLLSMNLGLLGMGIVTAVKGNRAAGLLPAGIFLGYHLANSFGRTSGGRYIVPVDWIVGLYFAIGVLQVTIWLIRRLGIMRPMLSEGEGTGYPGVLKKDVPQSLFKPALGLLMAGAILLLPDYVFPQVFEPMTVQQIRNQISLYYPDQLSEADLAYIDNLLLDKQGAVYIGKIMYPRYSARNASGELFFLGSQPSVEYPLLVFSLIGPRGSSSVLLAGPLLEDLPNYADAIVAGCDQHGRLEAAIVIQTSPTLNVYTRSPLPAPECPLTEPVCDNNGNCY